MSTYNRCRLHVYMADVWRKYLPPLPRSSNHSTSPSWILFPSTSPINRTSRCSNGLLGGYFLASWPELLCVSLLGEWGYWRHERHGLQTVVFGRYQHNRDTCTDYFKTPVDHGARVTFSPICDKNQQFSGKRKCIPYIWSISDSAAIACLSQWETTDFSSYLVSASTIQYSLSAKDMNIWLPGDAYYI